MCFNPGLQRRANGGGQADEYCGAAIWFLDDDLQLGPVLIVKQQRRQDHFWLARLAVTQNDQPRRRDTLGQRLVTQHKGGKRKQPRVKCGKDGFARGGHKLLIIYDFAQSLRMLIQAIGGFSGLCCTNRGGLPRLLQGISSFV